jgi:hypothetical protein
MKACAARVLSALGQFCTFAIPFESWERVLGGLAFCARSRLVSLGAKVHSDARLLLPAGRGLALLLIGWVAATPSRICVGATLSALLVGIAGNAILTRIEGRPPLSAQATPATVSVPSTAEADPSHPSAALIIRQAETQTPALTAGPGVPDVSRSNLGEPSTPVVPASPQKGAAPAERHASRTKRGRIAPAIRPRTDSDELQSAASATDPIGLLLRGKGSVSGTPVARQD